MTVGTGEGTPFSTGQVMTIFRSRKRPEAEAAYVQTAEQMEAAARAMPGFVDFKVFVAEDGERVSLITFDSPAAQQAWRDDPRHRLAQQQGRDDFYLEYSIQVGACGYVSQLVPPDRVTTSPGWSGGSRRSPTLRWFSLRSALTGTGGQVSPLVARALSGADRAGPGPAERPGDGGEPR